ncbi:uncharacterized protein EAE98_009174 [Botrytis deweyae]|uniref:Uncharacterized protein n=1 Tax=Botrytis deweyae TaxID=2478750 RepID=A0ABQ7ICD0_9HELO|nr:uncharacterized protein EAE98_009174 [Botrytis deweyae]KAF7919940.1 hypothetical protein EAE98_009174 [Botrytis deweyae]
MDFDAQLEPDGKREPDHIESGANVRRGTGYFYMDVSFESLATIAGNNIDSTVTEGLRGGEKIEVTDLW